MKVTSLHEIVTGLLLQRGYSVHYYIDFLIYAVRCLEELHFDVLGNIRAGKLPVNDFGEVTLPQDYMDEVSVSIMAGQSMRPMTHRRLNRLPNMVDSVQELYPQGMGLYGFQDTVLLNDHGEFTGRLYGMRTLSAESYSIIRERNIIQLSQNAGVSEIYLEYISDGSEVDNATAVHPYAKSTIEAYILWKHKEHRRVYSAGEARDDERKFEYQKRKLRGRLNPMTKADFKAAVYGNATGAPR